MAFPPLGQLAVQAGLLDPVGLERVLNVQRAKHRRGEFTRLGECLVEATRCPPRAVRELLARQGIALFACELCGTRYNAASFSGRAPCARCGRALRPAAEDASLRVEDAVVDPGPQGERALWELRRRNPRLGRYEVLGEVARGGMGIIYKAWDHQIQAPVALKFMLTAADAPYEDKIRFRREGEALIALRHDNIVRAYQVEEAEGLPYLVLQFVPGVPLDVTLERGRVSTDWIVRVLRQVALALEHVHRAGLIHRDVKPGNIVVTRESRPYLVDFGIAKNAAESMSLTLEGEVLGSLAFMAPEYVTQGVEALDPQCDVYGLGVVLYAALSRGQYPYGDPDADGEAMVLRMVNEPPTPLRVHAPALPPDLEEVAMRAIAKDRAARHPSAEALARDLERVLAAGGLR